MIPLYEFLGLRRSDAKIDPKDFKIMPGILQKLVLNTKLRNQSKNKEKPK